MSATREPAPKGETVAITSKGEQRIERQGRREARGLIVYPFSARLLQELPGAFSRSRPERRGAFAPRGWASPAALALREDGGGVDAPPMGPVIAVVAMRECVANDIPACCRHAHSVQSHALRFATASEGALSVTRANSLRLPLRSGDCAG
jgi:hypothetical protein